MGNMVREILDSTGHSVRDVVEDSGIPKSTIYRYLAGDADPTWQVVQELALACGLNAQLTLSPLSDPQAAEAAKYMLGALAGEPTAGVRDWIERIKRRHPGNDFEIIAEAGTAANPLHREGARYFRGDMNAITIASAGDITGKSWALSGAPVLEALELDGNNIPTLLWAEDAEGAARALSKSGIAIPQPDGANVVILPSRNRELEGAQDLSGIRIVAVVQGLLDVVDLSGAAREQVRRYTKEVK